MNATTDLNIDRVRGAERIASLDVIRGIAILFILFMNISWMGGYGFILFDPRYPTWTEADYWTTLVTNTWLEGTQRGLLELLFGAGIMIMARRAMTADGPVAVADLHYRRNLWLCAFGLANVMVLLWYGDILLVYGLAAVFLFPFRTVGPKAQSAVAALILAVLLAYTVMGHRERAQQIAKAEQIEASAAAGRPVSAEDKELLKQQKERTLRRTEMPAENEQAKKRIAEADKAHHSTFGAYWSAQFDAWIFLMTNWFWIIEAEIVATMLIGMALFQWGVIQGRARRRVYWALLLLGYGIGLSLRGSLWVERLQFQPGMYWQEILTDFSRLAVTLGHLGLIHLLLGSAMGMRLLRPFAAAGRIPLTIYLFTSFLMMWVVFAPWGFDLFGAWGQAKILAFAGAVIVAELVAANLWLRSFENGPLEWLWKGLAYGRREPFRKEPAAPPDALPSPA